MSQINSSRDSVYFDAAGEVEKSLFDAILQHHAELTAGKR
jgi:hypothetical protein